MWIIRKINLIKHTASLKNDTTQKHKFLRKREKLFFNFRQKIIGESYNIDEKNIFLTCHFYNFHLTILKKPFF